MSKNTPEILLSCPDCGAGNFTSRGLQGHRGTKHCKSLQAEHKQAKRKILSLATLDTMPALPRPSDLSEDQLLGQQLTAQWDKVVDGQRDQVIFGAMMLKLRERISSARGRVHPGGAASKGTGLEGWLKEHAPKVSKGSAYRMMDVAEGLADAFKLGAKVDMEWLLGAALENLPAAMAKKREDIEKVIDGRSQRQLLLEFGTPEKKRKGGARTKGEPTDEAPKKPVGWSDEAWERYLNLDPKMREAVDLWRPTLEFLHIQAGEETCIPHLPKAERNELEALHRQIGDLLSSLHTKKK